MCPQPTIYVSSYYYTRVLILLYMCPHTIYVSSYYYICVADTEDDITASVVVPADKLKHNFFRETRKSLKFAQNCEFRLFQVTC